jgi:putative heme-binding domain-containing protein
MWTILLLIFQAAANPNRTTEDVNIGREYFRLRCAECHGEAGEGGRGPNLADGVFFHGGTDEDLVGTIRNGVTGTEMQGYSLSEQRLRQVIAFIRSLNEAIPDSEIGGDARRGEKIFREKGSCLLCHRVAGRGGFAGPDLTRVGSRRSLAHLRASILAPDEDVRPRYWTATARDLDGKSTTGFILNEDRHSIQLLRFDGQLVSLDKSTLQEIERDRSSTMQSYEGQFDERELDDLVAYLSSLRGGR